MQSLQEGPCDRYELCGNIDDVKSYAADELARYMLAGVHKAPPVRACSGLITGQRKGGLGPIH